MIAELLGFLLLQSLTVFAATELTAKSELFRPLRERLLAAGVRATIRREDGKGRLFDPVVVFLSDAWTCPFCTSWWHAAWVAVTTGLLIGSWWIPSVTVIASVGLAKVIHDTGRQPQPPRGD